MGRVPKDEPDDGNGGRGKLRFDTGCRTVAVQSHQCSKDVQTCRRTEVRHRQGQWDGTEGAWRQKEGTREAKKWEARKERHMHSREGKSERTPGSARRDYRAQAFPGVSGHHTPNTALDQLTIQWIQRTYR